MTPVRPLDRLRASRQVLGGVDADGAKVHPSMFDPDVLSLAHGDGTRRPHPDVIAAGVTALLDSRRASLDDYHFLQRHTEFEAAVTADFEHNGIPPEIAANICADSGTTRLFAAFLHAWTQPGDVFLVPTSYYHPLPSWCDLFGVELSLVPTIAEHSFKLTPEVLGEHLAANPQHAGQVRGLFLFNPTQTGAVYTPEELKAIAEAVFEHDLVVLEDCVFAGTEFPGEPRVHHLAATVPEVAGRVVTIKGGSKAFNLANIRIGWGCGPADVIGRMNDHTTTTLATVPYIAKAMAFAALRAPHTYLHANSAECAGRVALITELVDEANRDLAAWSDRPVLHIPHRPQAGHGMLVSAPGLLGRRRAGEPFIRTSVDIARLLLRDARVAVSPGYSLGFDGAELRLVFGSVGLKQTYAGAVDTELLSAITSVADTCTQSRPAIADGLMRMAEALPLGADDDTSATFQPGRDLIVHAFRERITPALAAFLSASQAESP
ncbi:aminotransferase class I/II-fold pyridoxal phosphate-dependent enzyme [Dactylosporangium sp. AC04546]|uniref:aminotransferase class I/II-fold pyridoxal phosphate-dependent enzyme n=1 Tax=Dactylosporangium sp. AC04546 TaxID=2862460 RepID=UPI001EE07A87|nr:aminotransferase class I/II-fold pyridoxal phosphate-dependent enzyme [Dactylosporangium sp. AC04546]WVK86748.1 aminotransferase class I/II-fold pyridoxal phosphate-dependent enzyme [Dactylosporangium sp. AC04546]